MTQFEPFLSEELKKFEQHLVDIQQSRKTRGERMKGARQFVLFLLGRPADYNEQTKGRI